MSDFDLTSHVAYTGNKEGEVVLGSYFLQNTI